MNASPRTSAPTPMLDLRRLLEPVEDVLGRFLARKTESTAAGRHLAHLVQPLQGFVDAGGKRIRPLLAMVGWHAAGATGHPATAHHLAASLELFHAFCLIHDDVMDHSATRRGQPTVHRAQADHYRQHPPGTGLRDETGRAADRFGEGAAILIGDLALVWSDELLHAGNPTPAQLQRIRPLLDAMRTEVTLGQYLDLVHTGQETADLHSALTVIHYKTAKYTIERPLQLGAALAGADQALQDALSAYAIPLGEAFQLRDDLLGVFGNPQTTGKPALDDLREGKATALIALTLQHATPAQADQLRLFLGCPTLTDHQAETARRIIQDTGADHTVNTMITERYEQALTALDSAPIAPAATDALRRLADQAVTRTS
ncbi:geranylgeranyl diphosphate synthase [Streptomyces albireticuli]|uniref:Geranylgeranyl diphosphate synthase n=1 Tax=Streptomyces albireticuli TaxID=1940 RepID=A0A1Z2LDX2_9ACTN|nr:polyprenyl synthetase family protein [Streptomyces albireticuli]ARZ72516.1 geranylgeranyl diphosphate synthase [Streptomyces albireticuli]